MTFDSEYTTRNAPVERESILRAASDIVGVREGTQDSHIPQRVICYRQLRLDIEYLKRWIAEHACSLLPGRAPAEEPEESRLERHVPIRLWTTILYVGDAILLILRCRSGIE